MRLPTLPATKLIVLGTTCAWFFVIGRFRAGNVYQAMGPFASGVCVVLLSLQPRALLELLRPRLGPIVIGLGVGAVMTLATYPVFRVAVALWPGLDARVSDLYAGARNVPLSQALGWTLAVILAEELLWRGAWLQVLAPRCSPTVAGVVSVATYVAAQFGTGSMIVALMALVCGVIWTAQRQLTQSLLSSLIAHLIWTPIVILFIPVT